MELPFTFANISRWGGAPFIQDLPPAVIERVTGVLHNAWLGFVHDGDPNREGAPSWRPYTAENRARSRRRGRQHPGRDRQRQGPIRQPVIVALASLSPAVGACVHVTDLSSALTSLVILGPRSPDLLARLVRLDTDPRAFADRTLASTGAVGVPLQLLRWDRASLLAYELWVGRDVAEYFWEAVTHAGEDLGLKPIGAEALSRLSAE